MYGRIVKSECILTKLHVLDYEYLWDRIAKFHKKILFITRIISIQILTTKYSSFQYTVALHTAVRHSGVNKWRETVHLLTHETPDFITPALWPANSPGLNPVDYQIWGKLQERVYRSQIRDVDQLEVAPDRRVGTFPAGGHRWSGLLRQWRPRLRACVRAHGGHFEHRL